MKGGNGEWVETGNGVSCSSWVRRTACFVLFDSNLTFSKNDYSNHKIIIHGNFNREMVSRPKREPLISLWFPAESGKLILY